MIKAVLASKAAKLVAACVCPVAGTVAVTVAVPQVRSAVHKATAPKPRAYALPKTRVRQPASAMTAAPPVALAAAAPCEPVFQANALSNGFGPADLNGDVGDLGLLTSGPPTLQRDGGIDGNSPIFPVLTGPAVPEPKAWVQMLIGFGLIGGAARYSLRHPKAAAPEAEA